MSFNPFDKDSRTSSTGAGSLRPSAAKRAARTNGTSTKFVLDDSSRIFALLIILAFLAALIVCKLFVLQVVQAEENSQKAFNTRLTTPKRIAHRGTIYDRNGIVLAMSVDAVTITANPKEIKDASSAAYQLATVLGGKIADYRDLLNQDTGYVYIKRQVDVDVAQQVKDLNIEGIYFEDDTKRVYPYGEVAGQVIGGVDADGNGISGLEMYYDDILAGTNGSYKAEQGVYGIPITDGVVEDVASIDGQDIMISIDIELQASLEESIAQCKNDLSAESSNAVVMDGATGEIYAIASLPLFNPGDRSTVEEGATTIFDVTSAIEPGSVFKTVSAMSILETGSMTPESTIYCPAVIYADEYTVSDAHSRGSETMTLAEIIAESSNIGISLSTAQMGFDKLYRKILHYQLLDLTGIDYPGEACGTLTDQSTWSLIQSYNVSFGQGVTVTPLSLTRFYAAISNNGWATTPHFLLMNTSTGETATYDTTRIIIDEEAITDMVGMLEGVVTDGTGTNAAIDGYRIVGKSSTAEIASSSGGYKTGVYNLAFCGFTADCDTQLVCFVGATEVGSQSSVAYIFHDIMESAINRFNVVPNDNVSADED